MREMGARGATAARARGATAARGVTAAWGMTGVPSLADSERGAFTARTRQDSRRMKLFLDQVFHGPIFRAEVLCGLSPGCRSGGQSRPAPPVVASRRAAPWCWGYGPRLRVGGPTRGLVARSESRTLRESPPRAARRPLEGAPARGGFRRSRRLGRKRSRQKPEAQTANGEKRSARTSVQRGTAPRRGDRAGNGPIVERETPTPPHAPRFGRFLALAVPPPKFWAIASSDLGYADKTRRFCSRR